MAKIKRPFGLVAVVVYMAALAAITLWDGILPMLTHYELLKSSPYILISFSVVPCAFGAAFLTMALGLFRLKDWACKIAFWLLVYSFFFSIIVIVFVTLFDRQVATGVMVWLLIHSGAFASAVFYLSRTKTKALFVSEEDLIDASSGKTETGTTNRKPLGLMVIYMYMILLSIIVFFISPLLFFIAHIDSSPDLSGLIASASPCVFSVILFVAASALWALKEWGRNVVFLWIALVNIPVGLITILYLYSIIIYGGSGYILLGYFLLQLVNISGSLFIMFYLSRKRTKALFLPKVDSTSVSVGRN